MKPVKRLTVAGGKYMYNGVEKTRWIDIGTLFQRDDGKYTILMNAGINLAAYIDKQGSSTDVWVNLFDINRDKKPVSSQSEPLQVQTDEDVPF